MASLEEKKHLPCLYTFPSTNNDTLQQLHSQKTSQKVKYICIIILNPSSRVTYHKKSSLNRDIGGFLYYNALKWKLRKSQLEWFKQWKENRHQANQNKRQGVKENGINLASLTLYFLWPNRGREKNWLFFVFIIHSQKCGTECLHLITPASIISFFSHHVLSSITLISHQWFPCIHFC